MKEKFILSFDIPVNMDSFKLKINRELHRIGAKRIQQSMWQSDDLSKLVRICVLIKNVGGAARVLEERLIFY